MASSMSVLSFCLLFFVGVANSLQISRQQRIPTCALCRRGYHPSTSTMPVPAIIRSSQIIRFATTSGADVVAAIASERPSFLSRMQATFSKKKIARVDKVNFLNEELDHILESGSSMPTSFEEDIAQLMDTFSRIKFQLPQRSIQLISLALFKLKEEGRVMTSITTSRVLNALQIYKVGGRGKKYVLELLSALRAHIEERLAEPFTAEQLSDSLFGLNGFSSAESEVQTYLRILADKLANCSDQMTAPQFSRAMYGLRCMSSTPEAVQGVLTALTDAAGSLKDRLQSKDVGSLLHGLHGKTSKNEVVLSLLKAITPRIAESGEVWSPQTIEVALTNFKTMDSHVPEVRSFISAIARKIEHSKGDFTAEIISRSLCGLRTLHSKHEEVRSLIKHLVPHIAASTAVMSAVELSYALEGLRYLSSRHSEVRQLTRSLEAKVRHSTGNFNARGLAYALSGLKFMDSDDKSTRDLVDVLTPKVLAAEGIFNGTDIARATTGLHLMSSDAEEVQKLLEALTAKISQSDGKILTASDLCSSLSNLQRMSSDQPAVTGFLITLLEKMEYVTTFSKPVRARQLVCLEGLQGLKSSSADVQRLLTAMVPVIKYCQGAVTGDVVSGLFGLQQCSSNDAEVRTLMDAIAPLMTTCPPSELGLREVSRALYGLRGISLSTEWVKVVTRWVSSVNQTVHDTDTLHNLPADLVKEAYQYLVLVGNPDCELGTSLVSSGLATTLESIQSVLYSRLKDFHHFHHTVDDQETAALAIEIPDPNDPPLHHQHHTHITIPRFSAEQHTIAQIATTALAPHLNITVEANTFLHGFDADLVIRVFPPSSAPVPVPVTKPNPAAAPRSYSKSSKHVAVAAPIVADRELSYPYIANESAADQVIVLQLDEQKSHQRYRDHWKRGVQFDALRDEYMARQYGIKVVHWDVHSAEMKAKRASDVASDVLSLVGGLSSVLHEDSDFSLFGEGLGRDHSISSSSSY